MQLKKQLKSKLKYLNDQGFGNKSKNLKLLALCNGDIDKVLEILRMKINNETK